MNAPPHEIGTSRIACARCRARRNPDPLRPGRSRQISRTFCTAPGGRQPAAQLLQIAETMQVPIGILWPFASVRWLYELNHTYSDPLPPTRRSRS
jgi:hypothetical protein